MITAAKPQVLVLTPDFPPAKGGIQTLSERVVSAFPTFESTIVTIDHPDAAGFDRARTLRVIRSPRLPGPQSLRISGVNLVALQTAVRKRPDVVLSMHIVMSPAAAFLRRSLQIPFVEYVHAKEIGARPALARFALTRADRVVTVSHYTLGLARRAGADPDRVALIHPGVDLPPNLSPKRRRDQLPTILTISRLEDSYKGHDVVLRALPLVCEQIPDVRWRVVGDGPLRSSLEDQARALGLQNVVRFLGALDDATRDEEFARSDVFCMVSRLPGGALAGEGFGIAYLEANAHGLPVVAGAVGGATDAVVHGETGLLVDPEDHVVVAEALVSLLSDRRLAERLGSQGRERARRFSWEGVARQVEAELRSVLR